MKIIITYSSLLLYLTYFANYALADVFCQPIYGGGETCIVSPDIAINKQILNPKTNKFVDNLSINDPKYHPEFIVNFKLTVTNTSKSAIKNINVKDIFPQYITFSSGPGKFDETAKTLSFSIDSLEPNETKTLAVVGRVASTADLPQGIVCVVNRAIVLLDSQDQASDNTQLCIENKVVEVPKEKAFPVFPPPTITETPPTGPTPIPLAIFILAGVVGFIIRKKSLSNFREERR